MKGISMHRTPRPSTILLAGTLFLLSSSLPAGVVRQSSSDPAVRQKERAISAARQMREYRSRLPVLTKAVRQTDAVRKHVGITLDNASQTASTVFFFDNLESGSGWTPVAYSGADIWHYDELDATSPVKSLWAGIDSQATYETGTRVNAAAVSPVIHLESAVAPVTLMFAENFATERGWDYCMVGVSTDGGASWTELRGAYGSAPSGSSDGWQLTSLDLSPYAGDSVKIRFYFDTGDEQFNEFPGWFVDDIVVFDQGGMITGKKFFDVNDDGVKDAGERGVKNWYITASGPITLTVKTNYRGRYWLPLPLGTYTVSEETRPGWTQTYPPSGSWSVGLATPDTLVDSIHFGNYTLASFIDGKKFHDLDHDGVFNNADTALPEWKILLSDTAGNQIDFDRTDSLGNYELYVFSPGTYVVSEVDKAGWIQTAPPTESYTVIVPGFGTTFSGYDFGNYDAPLSNAIIGEKFNDRNRNGARDAGEEGLAGFTIQLQVKGGGSNYANYKKRTTDSSGYFQFLSVPADTYRVRELPREGWWQSAPDSFYGLVLNSGETLDSVDFGNFGISPGAVGGMTWFDANADAVHDSSEVGLSDWKISLSGTTYFGAAVNHLATTGGSGDYAFDDVWPGNYTVSEVWKGGWTQTSPTALGVHHFALGLEQNAAGLDFGNVDSVLGFATWRSFVPESLALAVDKKGKHKPAVNAPDKTEFIFTLTNVYPDSALGLQLRFSAPYRPGSLELTPPGTITVVGTKDKAVDITFGAKLGVGQHVALRGFTKKVTTELLTFQKWVFADSIVSYPGQVVVNTPRHPMPNAINAVQAVGTGLRVGLGGPHSVVHLNYKDVMKSLIERMDRMHIGIPRCIDFFAGSKPRSIKKQQRSLPPAKHNNQMLAQAIALNVNILASDAGVTPPGFGNLVFDDSTGGANPLNGVTVRDIAAKLDSFMSSFRDTIGEMMCKMPAGLGDMPVESLYVWVARINAAFSGPVDTNSFAAGLQFTGVGQLTDVGFLRYDARIAPINFAVQPPVVQQLPDEFALLQNYPNPFNPTTTLSFTLGEESYVTLKVYNMLGQEVATLADHELTADGDQELEFDAGSLPSGVYFYRIIAEGLGDSEEGIAGRTFTAVRKMLLVK